VRRFIGEANYLSCRVMRIAKRGQRVECETQVEAGNAADGNGAQVQNRGQVDTM
jgi:hypothetical protein